MVTFCLKKFFQVIMPQGWYLRALPSFKELNNKPELVCKNLMNKDKKIIAYLYFHEDKIFCLPASDIGWFWYTVKTDTKYILVKNRLLVKVLQFILRQTLKVYGSDFVAKKV